MALRPFFRLDAGVRAAAMRLDAYHHIALARGDDIAIFARRFQRQHGIATLYRFADQRNRRALVYLFIGQAKQGQRRVVAEVHRPQRFDGIKANQQTRFHIAGSGTDQAIAFPSQRSLRRRARRVDCIAVAQQEDIGGSISGQRRQQVIAGVFLREALQRETQAAKALFQPVVDAIAASFVVGAGIDRDQLAQIGQVAVQLRIEKSSERHLARHAAPAQYDTREDLGCFQQGIQLDIFIIAVQTFTRRSQDDRRHASAGIKAASVTARLPVKTVFMPSRLCVSRAASISG